MPVSGLSTRSFDTELATHQGRLRLCLTWERSLLFPTHQGRIPLCLTLQERSLLCLTLQGRSLLRLNIQSLRKMTSTLR